MTPHCLIVLSLLSLSLSAMSAAPLLGGWHAIVDINDTHVKGIAHFAVTEHNKQSGHNLKLESIIKGETQVVAGINYRLVLTAKDGSTAKRYLAVVYEKIWQHYKNLVSFDNFLD